MNRKLIGLGIIIMTIMMLSALTVINTADADGTEGVTTLDGLKTALGTESNITIGGSFEISESLTIDDGKYIVINDGVTITISNGVTLTNNGIIENSGTIENIGNIINAGDIYNNK